MHHVSGSSAHGEAPALGEVIGRPRLIRLNPCARFKTRGNAALAFQLESDRPEEVKEVALKTVLELSDFTGSEHQSGFGDRRRGDGPDDGLLPPGSHGDSGDRRGEVDSWMKRGSGIGASRKGAASLEHWQQWAPSCRTSPTS